MFRCDGCYLFYFCLLFYSGAPVESKSLGKVEASKSNLLKYGIEDQTRGRNQSISSHEPKIEGVIGAKSLMDNRTNISSTTQLSSRPKRKFGKFNTGTRAHQLSIRTNNEKLRMKLSVLKKNRFRRFCNDSAINCSPPFATYNEQSLSSEHRQKRTYTTLELQTIFNATCLPCITQFPWQVIEWPTSWVSTLPSFTSWANFLWSNVYG